MLPFQKLPELGALLFQAHRAEAPDLNLSGLHSGTHSSFIHLSIHSCTPSEHKLWTIQGLGIQREIADACSVILGLQCGRVMGGWETYS